ncbi:MAG: Spy/CpxP family protein refolding chaperone [Heteroscytonema crispum UTEX LB 1556]
MKLKNFSLLVGAIALSLTTTPFAVKAETNIKALNQIAQTSKPDPAQPPANDPLQLTPPQIAQIDQIRAQTRADIEAILTPKQMETLKTALQNRQGVNDAFAAMNLTSDQQRRMREAIESSQQKITNVLTPAQKQRLMQLQQNRTPNQPKSR